MGIPHRDGTGARCGSALEVAPAGKLVLPPPQDPGPVNDLAEYLKSL
jgi:hypothetical protein